MFEIEIPKPPTVPGSHLFFYILGGTLFLLACVAAWDILQKKQTLRHNFPVAAWLRYILESQREKIHSSSQSGAIAWHGRTSAWRSGSSRPPATCRHHS